MTTDSTTDFTIPTLETDRLILRAPHDNDFTAYAEFCASPRSAGVGGPYDHDASVVRFATLTAHWQDHGFGRWMLVEKTSNLPMGVVGLYHPDDWPEAEIAWSLFETAEGKGYAYEAAVAARAYAYDVLGWTTAISLVMANNPRSAALATRMGATQESIFDHPDLGAMPLWRHLSPDQVANTSSEVYA